MAKISTHISKTNTKNMPANQKSINMVDQISLYNIEQLNI